MIKLCCFLEGDQDYIYISILPTKNIDHLKRQIYQEAFNALAGYEARSLIVMRVNVDFRDVEHLITDGTYRPDANIQPLSSREKIGDVWGEKPSDDQLHVFVSRPVGSQTLVSKSGSDPAIIHSYWASRSKTVAELYKRLKEFRMVQVRGTPGSGKTTLLKLLHAHILSEDPGAIVESIIWWPGREPMTEYRNRLKAYIKTFPSFGRQNHYYLFDNGEETYWDAELWESFFKNDIQSVPRMFAVLFCSYGSPTARPVDYGRGIPLTLPTCARISLTPCTCPCSYSIPSRHTPIGLLFSKTEFDQCLERFETTECTFIDTDPTFRRALFEWTMGHPGATRCLLVFLSNQKAIQLKICKKETLTIYDLSREISETPVQVLLENLVGFSQGWPIGVDFGNVKIGRVFETVLTRGTITNDDDVDFCHRNGWLISGQMPCGQVYYTFPSPLHAIYVSWILMPPCPNCNFANVREMVFEILKQLVSSHLSSPSRIGPAFSERPVEARYQSEFYRVLYEVTGGCVRFSPELLTAQGAIKGRVNFFIPGLGWGIELIRGGTQLVEHSSRFDPDSKHEVWLDSGDTNQYIIVDCRTDVPVSQNPEIENLVHAVFDEEFRFVTILDNKLETVQGPDELKSISVI